jgi:hypothetical protein
MATNSIAYLQARLEEKFPTILRVRNCSLYGTFWTGIPQFDALTGGIPKSALTEICGAQVSSGKTTLLFSLLSRATENSFCALVDATDSFSVSSAQAAGINLSHLYWIRCGKRRPLEQAFKVADILLQNGGFGLIAVDISDLDERFVRRIPLTTWFRFSQVVARMPIALVFLEQQSHAGSCAGLVLQLKSNPQSWESAAPTHTQLFSSLDVEIEVTRLRAGTNFKRPVQSCNSHFTARAQWA